MKMQVLSVEAFVEDISGSSIGHSEALNMSATEHPFAQDISYAMAGQWVMDTIDATDLSDSDAVQERISASLRAIEDTRACAKWPIAAHAHMQLIQQLSTFTEVDLLFGADDMNFVRASKWADQQVMSVDLQDAFAIATKLAEIYEKLSDEAMCKMWPGTAFGYRRMLTQLAEFLGRLRLSIH